MTMLVRARRCALALLTVCLATPVFAWPDRPVTVIVPWPAGGPSDISARPLGRGLSALGQPFIIDNRAGAGGNIGTGFVAKAAPDGHTLLITSSGPLVINRHLYKKMSFDPKKDLQPITRLLQVPQVLAVHPSVPATDLKSLLAYIRSRNGDFQWASGGNGTTQHMTGEMFKAVTGVQMMHIPYKGSAPAITDVVGGQVPMLIDSALAVLPMIKAGKLRAIVVTGKQRAASLPEVPTAIESGLSEFESYAWFGLFAPAGTPKAIIDRLNRESLSFMRTPEYQRVLTETGSDFVGSDPTTFARLIEEEDARWEKLIHKLNISLD